MSLTYLGRVLAGRCVHCKLAVWLMPGETREPMLHGSCADRIQYEAARKS